MEDFPETIETEEEDSNIAAGGKIMSTVSESETTCRIKLLRPELPPDLQPESATSLHCAVNVKEKVEISGLYFYHLKKKPVMALTEKQLIVLIKVPERNKPNTSVSRASVSK
ncbi:unnamed protein product [Gongylonema pulchrum]|uniref:Uncharacterized protein n=1 Tax=Gongylonema pulchrum TaxID=637853 RepID=A0A3P7S3R6_9BILA|nr:unnamed protein product [Gongylonema pulchrum]